MTIKFLNYITDISTFDFIDNYLIAIDTLDYKLKKLDLDNFEKLWDSENQVGDLLISCNKIYSYDFYEFDINGDRRRMTEIMDSLPISNNEIAELSAVSKNGLLLIETSAGNKVSKSVYNLKTKTFSKLGLEITPYVSYFNEKYFVMISKGYTLIIYNYLDEKLIFEKDFSEECKYYDSISEKYFDGQIMNIYEYEGDKIIVTTKYSNTYCFNFETGVELWKTNAYASYIEIVGDIGYATTGLSFYRINLKTGESLSYGWENDRLPNFIYKNKEYWPSGNQLVYNNNLLWYPVFSEGESFVLVINPTNGVYEQILHVDINEKIMGLKFFKDMMYVLDSGNVLQVYNVKM